jgi:hypothetical protein
VLLETSHFVDEAFEDAAHGGAVERRLRQRCQAIEHSALALGVVDGHLARSLQVSDGQHEPNALGHELEDLPIDFVDGEAESIEFRHGHDGNRTARRDKNLTS